ncbi:MAG: DUF4139 domain-containing protein [Candidatus Omnitrophota bacterium]
MKNNILVLICLFVFVLPVCAGAQEVSQSTQEDQQLIEVTVYNSNLGLIKDRRNISLAKGIGELRFMDVAAFIMPVTVHVESLNAPDAFAVLEQNYEYDLMNADKLLDKYIDKKIKIVDWNEYQGKKDVVEAILLSNNNGQIFKINDEIYLDYPGYKVLPQIPENLIAQPTLTWLYENTNSQPHSIEVSYLTTNINWMADYVVVLDKEDKAAGLNGWVSLDNRSGATYKNAKLKLVAGAVNRARPTLMAEDISSEFMGKAAARSAQFEEQSFFEYHIYDLQRKTTVKNNQTKQVSLLEADNISVKKEFLSPGQQYYYSGQYAGQKMKSPVSVYINFKNSEDNHLGMPLPEGIMRLYKEDKAGALQFIGEDRIKHTPKDEEVKLKIGEAFDVVCERVQTDYQRQGSWAHETEWEVTLRNHKDEKIIVGLLEPLYGEWQVMSSTHTYKKVDAFTLRFDVVVPKDEEVKVKYRIRVSYR